MKCPIFLNWSRANFFWNAPLFYVRIFWNAPFSPFSESDRNFQKICTWSILKQKMNRKLNSSILGHFEKLWKCYHMKNPSFTCLLGHLMVPPVFLDGISRNFRFFHSQSKIPKIIIRLNSGINRWISNSLKFTLDFDDCFCVNPYLEYFENVAVTF